MKFLLHLFTGRRACRDQRTVCRNWFLLPLCGSWGSNSDHQAWWQLPRPKVILLSISRLLPGKGLTEAEWLVWGHAERRGGLRIPTTTDSVSITFPIVIWKEKTTAIISILDLKCAPKAHMSTDWSQVLWNLYEMGPSRRLPGHRRHATERPGAFLFLLSSFPGIHWGLLCHTLPTLVWGLSTGPKATGSLQHYK